MPQTQWNGTEACLQHAGADDIYWCVPASTHISIKQKFKAYQKIVFLVFIHNLSTNFIRVWGKLYFFSFSFVFFIQIYIYDIVLNFSLFYMYIYFWSSAKKFSNITISSVLNRMMVILSENWECLFDLTAISLELFVPSLKQTLRDVHDCLRDKEQEMIGSKAMRRKHQDMVSNCLVRVSNFQYTQVTTPSIQKFLESERLIM